MILMQIQNSCGMLHGAYKLFLLVQGVHVHRIAQVVHHLQFWHLDSQSFGTSQGRSQNHSYFHRSTMFDIKQPIAILVFMITNQGHNPKENTHMDGYYITVV